MNSAPLRILVVEDDEDTCLNLCDILELDEHDVETVSTGAEAMAPGRLTAAEVVLLDRRLPDGTAEQLLPRLKSRSPEADVIIITGHADMDSAIAALRLGATDYLLKPINPEVLRACLRRLADRRRLAERLVQAERLAAIGEAMAGLTHESRNALARSQANLRRLSRRLKDQPELLELIDGALAAQQDVQHLFEDVRQYAAPLKLRREPTDIRHLINEAWEKLALERRGRDAQLHQIGWHDPEQSVGWHVPEPSEGRGPDDTQALCEIDQFSMRNAFRNIFENSLSASSDPVRIEVAFQNANIGEKPALGISIRDNGPGFPPESLGRIFDAFHTTKTHGTGLGLAIVKRTVEEHGGRVAIGSTGPGAEILLTLPRCPS